MTVIMTVTIPLTIFPVAFNLSHTSPPLSAIYLLCNPFVLRCNTIPWYSSLVSPVYSDASSVFARVTAC